MQFKITQRGVHDADGKEMEVGTVIECDTMPSYLIGKAVPAEGGTVAITNPEQGAIQQPVEDFTVIDKGRGWFVVAKDGEEVTKSLRADDVEGFDDMSADDKTAFVELNKAG